LEQQSTRFPRSKIFDSTIPNIFKKIFGNQLDNNQVLEDQVLVGQSSGELGQKLRGRDTCQRYRTQRRIVLSVYTPNCIQSIISLLILPLQNATSAPPRSHTWFALNCGPPHNQSWSTLILNSGLLYQSQFTFV
uniref:Uncharacterized protein n=1 Tax=Clytia hemisphaerica TaxID=252671 RepID=A0A7M5WL55_9CNID